MKNVTILLAVAAVLAMSAPVLAGTSWTNALGDNDYHKSGNWDTGVPGSPDSIGYINMPNLADIAKISTNTSGADTICVGGSAWTAGSYSGHAKMLAGSYTWSIGRLYIGELNNNGDATFVQEGGTLDLTNSSEDMRIGYGAASSGKFTFKGSGTLNVSGDDIAVGGYGTGIFEVIGGGGSISVSDDFFLFNDDLGGVADSELWATIDGTGITTIAVGDNAKLDGDLTITDGGGAGSAGTIYTLMTYDSHSGSFDTIVKPDNWTVDVGATAVTVTVPEPATMCLLAVGGIGVLIRRKRHV